MASRSKGKFVLAIDQGTTGSTALVVDAKGQVVASADQDFKQFYPEPGWVEHDLELIWKSVEFTVRAALRKAMISAEQISCIGITNQRETVGIWERSTGKALHRAIVWQCRRTTKHCEALRKRGLEKKVQRKTGLFLDPYFSATKISWLLEQNPKHLKRAQAGEVLAGTMDCFLVFRLSGGRSHITDVSNASRTSLMNLKTQAWDSEMLSLFKVPESCLPKIVDSSGRLAETRGLSFLPDGIPISGIAGDQQSALFGQGCWQAGMAKCTFGTGSFILMNTGRSPIESKNRLLTTVAWRLPGESATFALEGGAFVCGAAVQWLRDGLGLISSSPEVEDLAMTVKDNGGVTFVPALTGLGAPHWRPEARGLIHGITRGTEKGHIARATLEAMALQNADILSCMERDMHKKMSILRVDGGGSQNNLLMQLQADYMGRTVERPKMIETTSLGAAYLAGLGAGLWKNTRELSRIWKLNRKFQSQLNSQGRERVMKAWKRALQLA